MALANSKSFPWGGCCGSTHLFNNCVCCVQVAAFWTGIVAASSKYDSNSAIGRAVSAPICSAISSRVGICPCHRALLGVGLSMNSSSLPPSRRIAAFCNGSPAK